MSSRQLFLVAGHDLAKDPGAIAYDGTTEASLTVELRDKVLHLLAKQPGKWQGQTCNWLEGTTVRDKDSANLRKTIDDINAVAGREDFLLDIHFNFNADFAFGTEVFYAATTIPKNKQHAVDLCFMVAKAGGFKARGAKPDTMTAPGALGILRETTCPALLLEVCFLNKEDLYKYRTNIDAIAQAIANFLNQFA